MRKTIWQGDVGLIPVENVPEGAKLKDRTIALGEATGHHHTFRQESVQVFEKGGEQFVRVKQVGTLEHQEHAPLEVKRGIYKVVRQRVFDVQKGIRQVMD